MMKLEHWGHSHSPKEQLAKTHTPEDPDFSQVWIYLWEYGGPASAFNPERELYHLAKAIWNLTYGPNHISDYGKEFRSIQYLCRSLVVNRGSWGGPKGSSKNSANRWFLLCLKIGHALRSPCSPASTQELISECLSTFTQVLLMTALQKRWDLKCFSSFTTATVHR